MFPPTLALGAVAYALVQNDGNVIVAGAHRRAGGGSILGIHLPDK